MENDGARFVGKPHRSQRSVGRHELKGGRSRGERGAVPIMAPVFPETSTSVKAEGNTGVGRVVEGKGRHAFIEDRTVGCDGPGHCPKS